MSSQASASLVEIHPDPAGGDLGVVHFSRLPFQPKRLFWICGAGKGSIRADHAHRKCLQIILCIKGEFRLSLEWLHGSAGMTMKPGAYESIHPMTWVRMAGFSKDATALFLCSDPYDPADVIEDRREWEAVLRTGTTPKIP